MTGTGSRLRSARGECRGRASCSIPHRLQELGLPRLVALGLCLGGFMTRPVWRCCAGLARARSAWPSRAGSFSWRPPGSRPGYMAWIVPLAAAEEDRVARVLAFALCVYSCRKPCPSRRRPGGRRARRPRRTELPGRVPPQAREPLPLSQAARSGLRSPAASRQPRSIARRGHTKLSTAPSSREMGAERVRSADDAPSARRRRPGRRPVVVGDVESK